jgi:glycosyltransferase involved in cell wall biosynthesis
MSDLVLHPSYVEGGLGVYPQFEAASVGTPCLVNVGRHVLEQRSDRTLIAKTTSDFVNLNRTIEKIEDLMQSENERILNIKESESLRVSWKASSERYADIFKKVINV